MVRRGVKGHGPPSTANVKELRPWLRSEAELSAHQFMLSFLGFFESGRFVHESRARIRHGRSEQQPVEVVPNVVVVRDGLATMVAARSDRPSLALGVEKMWTGNRAETMAGIEDGLPADYRHDLHERRHADENPVVS